MAKFEVNLLLPGSDRIALIEAIESLIGVDRQEARRILQETPSLLKLCDSKDEADFLASELRSLGAMVEVRSERAVSNEPLLSADPEVHSTVVKLDTTRIPEDDLGAIANAARDWFERDDT